MSNQLNHNGVNHASGLFALDNKDLQVVLGTRLANLVITIYRRTLPIHLILEIDSGVDLCSTVTYLCEDNTDLPQLSDSALDALIPRHQIAPPKVVTFSGFCKGGFETKLAKEQMECINQSEILREWYQSSIMRAVEDGKNALMARFYRHLMTHAVHPKNTGMNAGLVEGGNVLGTPSDPVLLTPDTVDVWHMALVNTVKQMPRSNPVVQEYGASAENMFIFAPPILESLYMKNENYNSWAISGDCASCSMFKDTFDRMPRGIMPITSYCIEKRTVVNGGVKCTSYPVLFGKRYMGTKAALRIDTKNYESPDGDSLFFKVSFYHSIFTFDCRYMGISWVSIQDTQPETISCG